jgi:hypothetical protein
MNTRLIEDMSSQNSTLNDVVKRASEQECLKTQALKDLRALMENQETEKRQAIALAEKKWKETETLLTRNVEDVRKRAETAEMQAASILEATEELKKRHQSSVDELENNVKEYMVREEATGLKHQEETR